MLDSRSQGLHEVLLSAGILIGKNKVLEYLENGPFLNKVLSFLPCLDVPPDILVYFYVTPL